MAFVYGFRIGPSDYPSGMSEAFASIQEARDAAYAERMMGRSTGRVRKATPAEFAQVCEDMKRGIGRW